jgi:hypothetical protein
MVEHFGKERKAVPGNGRKVEENPYRSRLKGPSSRILTLVRSFLTLRGAPCCHGKCPQQGPPNAPEGRLGKQDPPAASIKVT